MALVEVGMGRLIPALTVALILSLLGHIWQATTYLELRDALTSAGAEVARLAEKLAGAQSLASACSDATEDLRELADKRELEAAGAREQAKSAAAGHEKQADAILAKPDPVPGDACASAQLLVDDWLSQRTSP